MREKARKAARQPGGLEEVEVADSGTSPSGALARREEARAVAGVLERLSPEDREIITWRCVEGLTYDEIGRRKGYSAPYARRVVGHLLSRLRFMLKEQADGGSR